MKNRIAAWTLILIMLLVPFASCAQDAKPVLSLTPAKAVLYVGTDGVGSSMQLAASVSPEGAGGKLVYTSSRPSVVTVDENGRMQAVKTGTATVACRTSDGSALKKTCRVTVRPQPPTSLILSDSALTMTPGTKHQMLLQILPANAVNQKVTWKSSKTSVAKVSSTGLITAVKPGTALITCKTRSGGLKETVTVNVSYEETDIYYLAIGQANYQHAQRLEASYDDAKRFEAMLKAGNFGQKSMQGDVFYDLTGQQIVQKLEALPSMGMDENDITYFYYSGHGIGGSDRAKRGALAGVDYAYTTGHVTVDQVRDYLSRVPGTVVVVLDCCLSGQYITAKGTAAIKSAQAQQALSEMVDVFKESPAAVSAKGINSLISGNPVKDKFRIIAACKPLNESYSVLPDSRLGHNGYSILTEWIASGVGIMGAQSGSIIDIGKLPADKNSDGYVTLSEIKKYASPRIVKELRKEGCSQTMMVWPTSGFYPVFARIN